MDRLKELFGMTVSREFRGPAAKLLNLQDENGHSYIGIVFYEQYRFHSSLTQSLDGLLHFLKHPITRGITPLFKHDLGEGAFIYATGKCQSIAEIIRQASDLKLTPGPRAGLELIVHSAKILAAVVENAQEEGIYSHGGLTPWRLMLRKDGTIQIMGFAIPQVEMLMYTEDTTQIPNEDSFRYAPPERMEPSIYEDVLSDLFSLALIGFELMTTRPMYDGSVRSILEAAQRGEVDMKLYEAQSAGLLDLHTHNFLKRCLSRQSERFNSIEEAIAQGESLLQNRQLQGMSLYALLSQCSQTVNRRSQEIKPLEEATMAMSRSALKAQMEAEAGIPPIVKADKNTLKSAPVVQVAAIQESSKEDIKISTSNHPSNTPKNAAQVGGTASLLDMLRASAQIAPVNVESEVEEITPPVPTTSSATNSLLQQLRASYSALPRESESSEPVGQKTPLEEPVKSQRPSFVSSITPRNTQVEEPIQNTAPAQPSSANRPSFVKTVRKEVQSVVANTEKMEDANVLPSNHQEVQPSSATTASIEDQPEDASKVASFIQKSPRRNESKPEPAPSTDKSVVHPASSSLDIPKIAPVSTPVEKPKIDVSKVPPPPPPEPFMEDDIATAMLDRNALRAQMLAESAQEEKIPEQSKSQQNPSPTKHLVEDIMSTTNHPFATLSERIQSTPQVIRMINPTGNIQEYILSLGGGAGSFKRKLPKEMTVAQALAGLMSRLLPMRMDLLGRSLGCYRFLINGELCSGRIKMKELDHHSPLLICTVPNDIAVVDLQVHTDDGIFYLTTPVGLAVSASSLVDYLVSWLRLIQGKWTLHVGDIEMDAYDALCDFDNLADTVLILKRK